jgi:uncharacterized protein YndB with AHSA1/START domain
MVIAGVPRGGVVRNKVIQDSVQVARPVEHVFAYATDPEHWPEWAGPVIKVKTPRPGPLTPGVEFTVIAKLVGRQFETHSSVTDYEDNRLLAYRSTSGPVPSTFTWRFEPVGSMTRITQTVEADEERTSGFFKLAFPLVEAAYRRQMAADLATLKDLLESRRP